MKTLKNLTLMAVVATLLFACEDPFKEEIESKDFSESGFKLEVNSSGNSIGENGQIILKNDEETPETYVSEELKKLTE